MSKRVTIRMDEIDFDDGTHARLLRAHENKEKIKIRYSKDGEPWKYAEGIITVFAHGTGDDYIVVEESCSTPPDAAEISK